jgi:L-ascorbate metabolism protein UlaG (beta-lactamase superfamily)
MFTLVTGVTRDQKGNRIAWKLPITATPALPPKSMENTCCLTHLSPRTLSPKRWISKIKADYILVSHAHFDHVTDTAAIADQTGATVISN